MKRRSPILLVQDEAGALIGKTKLLLEEVLLEDFLAMTRTKKLKSPQSQNSMTVQWKLKQKVLDDISWTL